MRDNAGPQPLRPDSYVVHMAKAKSGMPFRGGLARLAAWAYLFKNFTIKDWSIFLEAFGHPLRLGKYGPSASKEDRLTLLRAARQIGVDMAAIIPKDMDLEVIAASISGAEKLYEGNARYWDEQLSKGVHGQVATTDAIAGGHALGYIHERVRDDIRDAEAEQLAATLQRDVAGALARLNFGRPVALPHISFPPPETVDPKLMLELMERGPAAGLKISVAQVREVFALRAPEEGEEVLMPTAQAVATPTLPQLSQQTAAKAPAPTDSIDALVNELIAGGEMQRAMDGEIGALIEALSMATDMDQVRDILAAFDASSPGPIRSLLSRSTFAARVAGEVGAEIRG